MEEDPAVTAIPTFVTKLWTLVNDKAVELAYWAKDGQSFIISDPNEFSRRVIPLYFKHNSQSSFIRQLNMYGFHKVVPQDIDALRTDSGQIQFEHPYFKQNGKKYLPHVTRKLPSSKLNNDEVMMKILSELDDMRTRQNELESQCVSLQQSNNAYQKEARELKSRFVSQQNILKRIVSFLSRVVSPSTDLVQGQSRSYDQYGLPQAGRLPIADHRETQLTELDTPRGPQILEVTHINEADQSGYLDHVFNSSVETYQNRMQNQNTIRPVMSNQSDIPSITYNSDAVPIVQSPGQQLTNNPEVQYTPVNPADVMPNISTQPTAQNAKPMFPSQSRLNRQFSVQPTGAQVTMPGGEVKTIKLVSVSAPVSSNVASTSQVAQLSTNSSRPPYGRGKQIVEPRLRQSFSNNALRALHGEDDSQMTDLELNEQLRSFDRSLDQMGESLKSTADNIHSLPSLNLSEGFNEDFLTELLSGSPSNSIFPFVPHNTTEAESEELQSHKRPRLTLSINDAEVDECLNTPQISVDDMLM